MTTVTYYFDGYDVAEAWGNFPQYMVDGALGTWARSNVNNVVQLCNSNTCTGERIGTISKVEIRTYHAENFLGNTLKIRPVLLYGDGDTHTIANSVNATWSSWIDITNDTNAPATWLWRDIENLDCDVISIVPSGIHMWVMLIEIRVTYESYTDCGSCKSFTITGDTYTVELKMPHHDGEDNSIGKDINRFNFWSGNYDVNDDGINSQPLVLSGVEHASCDRDYVGLQLGECAPFNLYFNMRFTNKFRFLMEMSNNNEEVTISGLGDCMNATYIIKHFSYETDTPRSRSWTMMLEKVR